MTTREHSVRQSVTLAPEVARRVRTMAKSGRTTSSRVIADLIERGLEAKNSEKSHFLELADKLAKSKNPSEQRHLKDELARLTFGS